MSATKNRVSNRRGSQTGVTQWAWARRRSVRRHNPCSRSTSLNDNSRATRPARTCCHCGLDTSTRGPSSSALANSTPHSSKTSRTAATTSLRVASSSAPRRTDHSRTPGPAHGNSALSRGSTPPPGKTIVLGAKAIDATRRSRNTSTGLPPELPDSSSEASRTIITVAAGRSGAGSPCSPDSHAKAVACNAGALLVEKSRIMPGARVSRGRRR